VAWYRENELVHIDEEYDYLVDANNEQEVYCVFNNLGIKTILYLGAASNMCIETRADGMYNTRRWEYDTALFRDVTDCAYSPEDPPYLNKDEVCEIQNKFIETFIGTLGSLSYYDIIAPNVV